MIEDSTGMNNEERASIGTCFAHVPKRSNRREPWPFMKEGYRERNRVERLFNKLKQFRRRATRYDKLKETFLGMIHLALGFIRLRDLVNVNTA